MDYVFIAEEETLKYFLGDFNLGTTNNVLPNVWERCSYKLVNDQIFLFDFGDFQAVIQCIEDAGIVKRIFQCWKVLRFKFCQTESTVNLEIYLQVPIPKVDSTNLKKIRETYKLLFHQFFNVKYDISDTTPIGSGSSSELNNLYTSIKELRSVKCKVEDIPDESLQHENLVPILRPYQKEAVKWMLTREKESVNSEIIHPLYVEIKLKTDKVIYFAPSIGDILLDDKPVVPSLPAGGILADEMGLGKTVEVLACILNHQCNSSKAIKYEDIVDNSDEENSDESDDNIPISEIRKKRKLEQEIEYNKKQKLDQESSSVKPNTEKKRTGVDKAQLILWYEKKLAETRIKPKLRSDDTDIKHKILCVCGGSSKRDTVTCKTCKRKQHKKCACYTPDLGPFYCAPCWKNNPLIDTKATLIVCPSSLIKQWQEEIKKHLKKNKNLFVYSGHSATPVYPTKLKQFDIVLTTYSVLQNELLLVDLQTNHRLRRQSKYAKPGCPLTSVFWWRLCLDEAQMVESPNCKVSVMSTLLKAKYRWAITGTPISHGIQDLFGLLNYLDVVPYNEKVAWNNLLYFPYLAGDTKPMLSFLEEIMWRTMKSDVFDQIDIPAQSVKEYPLQFGNIEQYYYNREHEHCADQFLDTVSRFEDQTVTLASLHKSALKCLLAPLLHVRQACIHPFTSKGNYLSAKKQVGNITELLEALIDHNKVECEENLRAALASYNGIAGIMLLENMYQSAVEEYRKGLELTEKYKDTISADKLQRIHMLHNLAYVMETYRLETKADVSINAEQDTINSKDISIQQLRKECMEVEGQYMERYLQQTQNAFDEANISSMQVDEQRKKFEMKHGLWFSQIMNLIEENDMEHELLRKIDNEESNISKNKSHSFDSVRNILYAITIWNDKVDKMQGELRELLEKIGEKKEGEKMMCVRFVRTVVECHLRPDENEKVKGRKNKICLICVTNNHLKKYESILFNTVRRGILVKEKEDEKELSNLGNWKPSSEEIILKQIHSCAKSITKISNSVNKIAKTDGSKHLHLCFLLRKEFKALRKLWTYYDTLVAAQDELNMCKMRMELKDPTIPDKPKKNNVLKNLETEENNKFLTIHHLHVHELDFQKGKLELEKIDKLQMFTKHLGTRSYLQTLKNEQNSGAALNPCPVCRNALDEQYSILQCGHCYCLMCIENLIEQTPLQKFISCSVCRQKHTITSISYIRGKTTSMMEVIEGDLSTKIEAIVRLIRNLKNEDNLVKIIVFSTWSSVLNILKEGLEKNKIGNELIKQNADLEKKLSHFKDSSSGITALLLPINLGSKGLNIVEATNVIFVEPVINPADELQAVGRVHRIGQTKETTVHKFIVQNTVEEKIYRAISAKSEDWDKNKVTIRQLMDLFIEPS